MKIITISLLFLTLTFSGYQQENPAFQLYRLEKKLTDPDKYRVPANINAFRVHNNFSLADVSQAYLENCKELNITPFKFDKGSDVYRELFKMQFIWLGISPYPGYKEASVQFLKDVEQQLRNNSPVLEKFRSIFKKGNNYLTGIYDFVLNHDKIRRKISEFNRTAEIIAGMKSFNERFTNTKYYRKEEWSHPAYIYYQLNFYKERVNKRYDAVIKELEENNPEAKTRLDNILSVYDEGVQWLLKANLFLLEEKWFYDETQGEYRSIKDFLASFWEPVLGYLPDLKPGIVNLGEIDGTARGSVPYLEYPGLLKPLNQEGEQLLKNTPASHICDLFDTIGETVFENFGQNLPEGTVTAPLYSFIYSLKENEEAIQRSTHIFDSGCPITMMISNMPHEIAHYFHHIGQNYWKRNYVGNETVYQNYISNYILEGIAELCQLKSVEPIFKKFPILYHDNYLKHYICGTKDTGNHHTWGMLWFQTLYKIFDNDFNKLFHFSSEPGVSFEELINSPEFQTAEVLTLSEEKKPVLFPGQKRRRRSQTYVFPSCVIEFRDNSFHIVRLSDEYSDLSGYLKPTKFIDSDNPAIIQKAKELTENCNSETEKVKALFEYVRDSHNENPCEDYTASEVLKCGGNSCRRRSILFAALCRSLQIPVRLHLQKITIKNYKLSDGTVEDVTFAHGITGVSYNGNWRLFETVGNTDKWIAWTQDDYKGEEMTVEFRTDEDCLFKPDEKILIETLRINFHDRTKEMVKLINEIDNLAFLNETEHLDFSHPVFAEALSRIVNDDMSINEKLKRLFHFTRDSVAFYPDASLKASEALRKRKAICYTKAMIYVSFCRKLGVPAQIAGMQFAIKADPNPHVHSLHGIAKIYFNGKWLYIDTVSNRESWRLWNIPETAEFKPPEFSLERNVHVPCG